MSTRNKIKSRSTIVILLCLCVAIASVSVVFAYLISKTNTITNTLVPTKVTCEVEEKFTNGVKSDVKIRNTGNIDAYIRATVVATFVSSDNKVLSTAPIEGTDYPVSWASTGWVKGTDGFWYCEKPISPNAVTPNLISSASSLTTVDGYNLNIQIIATAIQSKPETAVEDAWGITVVNGKITFN